MAENVGDDRSSAVVVAFSSAFVRDAVRETIAKVAGLRVVGEARDWGDLQVLLQQQPPRILLLGAGLPGIDSPEALAALRRYTAETRVVIVVRSDIPPERMVEFEALQPSAVLTNDIHMDDLIRGLELVRRDMMVLPASYGRSLFPCHATQERARQILPSEAQLTPRERDLLRLFAQGYSEKEVATSLGIGRRTIHTHLEHIRSKLGASNRMHAVALVVAAGVVVLDGYPPSNTPRVIP